MKLAYDQLNSLSDAIAQLDDLTHTYGVTVNSASVEVDGLDVNITRDSDGNLVVDIR